MIVTGNCDAFRYCLTFASIHGLIGLFQCLYLPLPFIVGGRRDRMEVGFTTTCAISVYHHKSCEFESRSLRQVCGFLRLLRISPPEKLTATI